VSSFPDPPTHHNVFPVLSFQVTITVDPAAAAAGARIPEVLETAVPVTINEAGLSYTLQLSDLFAEEQRHLMLRATLPALAGAEPDWVFGALTLEYKDAMNDNVEEAVTVAVVVPRPEQADALNSARDPLIAANIMRLEGAKALAEAKRLGRLGQHQQAQTVLTASLATIQAGASGE
jgi:hypothetical protein